MERLGCYSHVHTIILIFGLCAVIVFTWHIPHDRCCNTAICGEDGYGSAQNEYWCMYTMGCNASTGWKCTCPVYNGIFGISGDLCYISCGQPCPAIDQYWGCLEGGRCVGGVCQCDTGSTCSGNGPGGCVDLDECASSPCQNGGVCSQPIPNYYQCACPVGFTDYNCQTNIDDCNPNPCANGGACSDGVNAYTCDCSSAAGWTGTRCQEPVDECASGPCANSGFCQDTVDGYTCNCVTAPGFTGTHCDENIDECLSGPCSNGGPCVDGVNGYTCDCSGSPGYGGLHCETDIDECASVPCSNGGSCTDGVASYACSCAAGYEGTHCEAETNECASNPCQNGGACSDSHLMFTCSCPAGYTGISCETGIDECASGPCSNGGVCVDGVNSYTCSCDITLYSGTHCELEVPQCDLDEAEKAKRVMMMTVQTLSCGTILIMVGSLIGIFVMLNEWRYERILHLGQEVPFFVAHLLILIFRTPPILGMNFSCPGDSGEAPAISDDNCKKVALALHYLFMVFFAFLLMEGINAYTRATYVNLKIPFLKDKGLTIGLGVFGSLAVVLPTAILHYDTYTSSITCWLSFDTANNAYGELIPGTIAAWTAIILSESTGIRDYPRHPKAREALISSGRLSAAGILFVGPLTYLSWFSGMLAVHTIDLTIYTVASALNMAAAASFLVWHTTSNERARHLVMKYFLCLCVKCCRGCCDFPQKKRKVRARPKRPVTPEQEQPDEGEDHMIEEERLPEPQELTEEELEIAKQHLYAWVSDGRSDNRKVGLPVDILFTGAEPTEQLNS